MIELLTIAVLALVLIVAVLFMARRNIQRGRFWRDMAELSDQIDTIMDPPTPTPNPVVQSTSATEPEPLEWYVRAIPGGPVYGMEVLPEPEYQQAMIGQDAPAQSALGLTTMPVDARKSPDVPTIPSNQVIPGDNDRTAFDPVALRELADSIAEHGLAQPITVRPIENSLYQIVAGERRFRAMELLGWTEVPALVRVLSDEEASSIMLLENVQRADLNPIDEARAYQKRMQQYAWSVAQCAQNASVPPSRVKSRLALLTLIEDAQLLVRSGSLGLGYAECMSELDSNRQVIALRYFSSVKRPNITEYKALCNQLLENQQQECLFDMSAFMQAVDTGRLEATLERANRKYPTNDRIPAPPKAKTIGAYFEEYISLLLRDGAPESLASAEVVGTVYDGAKRNGLAKPPKDSPLSSNTTMEV